MKKLAVDSFFLSFSLVKRSKFEGKMVGGKNPEGYNYPYMFFIKKYWMKFKKNREWKLL